MNDSIGNSMISKKYFFQILVIIGLCYGCEDKTEQQEIDPKNLFKFVLKDVNPNSKSYNNDIGPSLYEGKVSLYYFGDPG